MLIIGYERVSTTVWPLTDITASQSHVSSGTLTPLTFSKRLASCQPPIGLIVCDEGHRLKSKDNKTTKMFDVLSTPRRISG